MSIQVGSRKLYVTEALLMGLMLPLGAVWPSVFTLLALASLPALFVALRAAYRPGYLDPEGFRDPRRGLRRYVHVMAVLCMFGEAAEILWLLEASR